MMLRCSALVAGVLALATVALGAPAAPKTPPPPAPSPDAGLLKQIADAQRSLGEAIQEIMGKLDGLAAQGAGGRDDHDAIGDDIKNAREEVKGLYVEISGLKQQMEELKTQVGGVDDNVTEGRTYSSFFLAIVVVLQILASITVWLRR